MNLKVERTIE